MSRSARTAIAAGVGGFLAFLYLRTLAPGLTWAFDGADGGDLVTAAATGGVAHPTGYPTYLLIASAFLRLPVGALAYRTNLLSAICTIVAALLIFAVVLKAGGSAFAGAIAAIAYGTFPLAWSQAIITEVNALHAAFVAGILYLVIAGPRGRLADIGAGLVAGLGVGNHMSTLLALPLLALGPEQAEAKLSFVGRRPGLRRAVGVLMGLSVYAVIPLRAANQAPVNWGNATDWNGFTWLVSGRLYWARFDQFGFNYVWTAFRAWSQFLISQVNVVGLVLVFVALAFVTRRSLLFSATGYLAGLYSLLSILYYSPDSYVYLLPLLISLAIWIGLASQWLLERMPVQRIMWQRIAGIAFVAAFAGRSLMSIPAMDLSHDDSAMRFAKNALHNAPDNAVVLTSGDEATFSLWYYRFAERQRPDVAVVAPDMLSLGWYRKTLTETYPHLVWPKDSLTTEIERANPDRPVCTTDLESHGRLACEP